MIAPDNQPSGVPEKSVSVLLQRGGEELALVKVSDRFTIRPTSSTVTKQLTSALPIKRDREIQNAQLQEFSVAPKQRDAAMQAARNNQQVAFASHVYQLKDNPETRIYLTDQITIQFSSEAAEIREKIPKEFGLQLLKPVLGIPNTFVYQLTEQSTENPVKIANRLMGYQEVLVAEPNIIIPQESHYRPKDPLYSRQWYLNHNGGSELAPSSHINIEKAWDITRGIRSVVVAITDDAIDLNHPDFQGTGKIVAPRDFKDNDFLPLAESSDESHGTACAGVAVAEENGKGIVGVAPGCALMPIRTTGFLDDETIEQLFDWAIVNNASVISCSWGPAAVYFPLSLRQSAALTRAATQGRQGKGCVIVFAAGNANRPVSGTIFEKGWQNNQLQGPTDWLGGFTIHPDTVTVTACTSLGKKSAYSNWGTGVTVCAPSNNAPPGIWFEKTGYTATAPDIMAPLPGLGIFTADLLGEVGYETGDFTNTFGGTSSACPVVAGVCALVLSANPDLTAQEVKRLIQETADKIVDREPDPQLGMRLGTYDTNGFSQWFGYGKINAFQAVQAAKKVSKPLQAAVQFLHGRNANAVKIPDNNPQGIKSTIGVNSPSFLREIQITVDIKHDFLGDIVVNLIAPNGQVVLLQGRTLGSKTSLQTIYSLDSTPALKQLLNKPAAGTWQLQVIDLSPVDLGVLNSWELLVGV